MIVAKDDDGDDDDENGCDDNDFVDEDCTSLFSSSFENI